MKNLCLDIGNVLCEVKFDNFINLLSSRLNLSYNEVWNFLNRVQKIHDLGIASLKDELQDHFKIKSESLTEELIESWNQCLIPNWEVINRMQNIGQNLNIEIALLSNIGLEHCELFNKKVKFDTAIKHFSCHVGARKPTLLYYQSFLLQYPQFKGATYVDDNLDNLAAGKKMGFDSIYFNLTDKKEIPAPNSRSTDILLADTLENIIKDTMKGLS